MVGSNDITAPVIEASYLRFLIFDELLQRRFVLGDRPGCRRHRPATNGITPPKRLSTPSRAAWTDIVDDLSGQPAEDEDWIKPGIRERG